MKKYKSILIDFLSGSPSQSSQKFHALTWNERHDFITRVCDTQNISNDKKIKLFSFFLRDAPTVHSQAANEAINEIRQTKLTNVNK